MKQVLKQITKMRKRLNRIKCGHESTVETHIVDINEAHTQMENGSEFSYPETVEVKIENWSNHFYSVRTSDGRWIREGTELSGKGLSLGQVYRRMLVEARDEQFRRNLDSITLTDIETFRKNKKLGVK